MINEVLETLKHKISDFAANTNGQFLGERVLVSRRRAPVCEATVEYPLYKISFMYHRGTRRGPKSVLSCMFHIKSETQSMGYLIYDILNIIDTEDFSCYTYAFIPDKEAFEGCLDELCQKLIVNFDKINAVFDSPEICARLRETKIADINNYFDKDVFKTASDFEPEMRDDYFRHVYDLFFAHLMSFFVSRSYALYLEGDKKGAYAMMRSSRQPTEYQRRFLQHLKDGTPAQTSKNSYLHDGILAQSKSAVALPTILVMIVLGALLCPVFYGLHYLFIYLFTNGALYNTAAEFENAVFCVFPALITSAAITVLLKKFIINLTGKKTRARLKRFGNIIFYNPKKTTLFYGVFTAAVISVIMSMVIANTGVKFFDKTMKINASPSQLRAVEYTYSQIDEVTETEGPYGTTITTIKFSDGKMFSLVGVGDETSVKTKIYPILKQKDIEITKKELAK